MAGKVLYWLAVLVISLAVLVALVLFFESRDPTSVEGAAAVIGTRAPLPRPR